MVPVPREIYSFADPERFIIGTVGVPGEREFYLQVRDEEQLRSFALEKSQAAALNDRFIEILRELGESSGDLVDDSAPLDTPVDSEFTIGVMSISWRPETRDLLFEAQAIGSDSTEEIFAELVTDDLLEAPAILRVVIPVAMARGFVKRTAHVLAAGRQPCIFCGAPLNPGGHLCPRANGYRRSS